MDDTIVTSAENNVPELAEQEQTEQTEFTDTQESEAENKDGKGEGGASTETSSQTEQTAKAQQSAEENAKYARERRKAEEAKRLKEAQETTRIQTIIDVTGGKNPYTGEAINDAHDVDEYLLMKRIEKEGGDPVADYAKAKVKADREAAQKAQAEREAAEKRSKDITEFREKYPDVNIEQLVNDDAFSDYAEGKVGTKPLADIYAGYLKLTGKANAEGKKEVARQFANAKASPGSTNSTNPQEGFFTNEQVKKMTPEEVKKNYDVILKSMSKW